MITFQALTQLNHQELKGKFHSVPEYAIPKTKYSDKTANDLTKSILDYIRLSGNDHAERVNSCGRSWNIGGQDMWIPTAGQKGTADISATKLIELDGRKIGVKVAIGVKIVRDRQSEAQRQ
jgi:hypothetical protein